MSALVLASVVEDVKQNLAAEREYASKLKTCQCHTEYIIYADHPGPIHLCRKCANRFVEKQAWAQQDRLFVGDLVVMCDHTHLSFQWQEALNPLILEEMQLEPVFARLGVVKRVLDNLTVEVQSLRLPNIIATKIYIPEDKDNLIEKVGHIIHEHGIGPVKTLYPFAAFVYTEMLRTGRSAGFRIELPSEPRGQN